MSAPVSTPPDRREIPAAARPGTQRPPFPSTWSLKVWMAITGSVFALFVVVHLVGNLKVYLGQEALNHYAEWLQQDVLYPLVPKGWFVWIFRGVLFACLVIHIASAWIIRSRGRRARGPHKRRGLKGLANFQARSMLVTGIVLFCFLVFHLLDLTIGAQPIASDSFARGDAYANLVHSFQRPGVAIFYILAMAVLFLHLAHGLWSVVNDLGATGKRFRAACLALAGVVALLIMLGNILIPFTVMVGLVTV